MKPSEVWFDEYGVNHQNRTNKLIHWFCVPLIFFSIIAMLASIPAAGLKSYFPVNLQPYIHFGTLGLIICLIFYRRLSFTMTIGMFLLSIVFLQGIIWLQLLPFPLWLSSLVIFTVAWIGQFIGHKIEGSKPTFFKDIQFLLIGPAWLMGFVFKQFKIPY